jgi:hypothetical protein
MSIKTNLASIETTQFKNTHSPQKTKIEDQTKAENILKSTDLSDLHEATQKNENGTNEITEIKDTPIAKNTDSKKLGILEKFLDDNWGVRIYSALGNEIAESFYDLAAHILPKPVANALYGGLWSVAIGATGARVVANTSHAESKDKFKAGGKLLLHDGISAITAPTIVARTMNFIQNKLYKPLPLPETLKHLVKSIISILTCKVAIQKLDPIAMKLSGKLFNYTNDRHSEINKVEPGDKDGLRNLSFASAA